MDDLLVTLKLCGAGAGAILRNLTMEIPGRGDSAPEPQLTVESLYNGWGGRREKPHGLGVEPQAILKTAELFSNPDTYIRLVSELLDLPAQGRPA